MQIRDRIKELRRVPARDLIPNKKNWRKHPKAQADAMREVLESIGYAGALLAREDKGKLHLIDGHMRTETTPDAIVPVLVLDVTAAEADTILATFDPLSAMAVADSSKLEELMAGMTIGEGAIADMMKGVRDTAKEMQDMAVTEDEAPAPLPDPVSKTGDLWLLGEHRLLCGDSTSAADIARLMDGKKAALCATDPPYLVDYTGDRPNDSGKDWSGTYREIDITDADGFFTALFTNVLEAIAPKAAIYCWHAHKRCGLIQNVWERLGILDHQQIVWVKPSSVFGRVFWHFRHEPCMMGWRKGSMPEHDSGHEFNSVWEIDWEGKSRIIGNEHPTQKPLEIFARPMRKHTRHGDICFEPFSGSGSQLIAAEQTGRRCFANEMAPTFVDVAIRRWQKLTGKAATHSETGKTWEETAKARGVTIKEPTA